MAQLRLAYPEIQKRGAEIVQVSNSTLEEARLYFRQYQLVFPYLCDPEREVYRRYGIPIYDRGLTEVTRTSLLCVSAVVTDLVLRGERSPSPAPYFKRYGRTQEDQAVFIVDRDGIIRYVYTSGPIGVVPSNEDLLRELAALE